MARTSNNSVDKKLEAVSTTKMAEKDPMHHIDLELSSTLKQMFEEAKREGFTGSFDQYLDTLSMEELKRVGSKDGGPIFQIIADKNIKSAIRKLKKKNLI
jgi:hypothetical protein